MATVLTIKQWTNILKDPNLTIQLDIDIFQIMYGFENYKASASQIGRILNGESKMPGSNINLEIGRYAKRIANYYDIDFTRRSAQKYKYWDLFFETGGYQGILFLWKLRKELAIAFQKSGCLVEEQYAEEIPYEAQKNLFEGAKKTIQVNVYERSPKARIACIKHYGIKCVVCDFDFVKKYGEIGKDFIHVHHITPISKIKINYEVNPIEHLRPVCPNCHAMLHKEEPPITIEVLKKIIKKT